MNNLLLFLTLIFIIKHIIEIWLIFTYQKLIKGGIILGAMEAVEIPLIIYLIMKVGLIVFLIIVLVEIIEWLTIGHLTFKR